MTKSTVPTKSDSELLAVSAAQPMERHCELSDDEKELLADLKSFEKPSFLADDRQFIADEDELVAGIFETLDRSQQQEFLKPIVADRAYVYAEQLVAEADPVFAASIDVSYHADVIRCSDSWLLGLDAESIAAMNQWFEEQFRSSVARLGYGYLLQTQNASRVCWQKEGF